MEYYFPGLLWLSRPAGKYYYTTYASGLGRPWAIRGIILLCPMLRAQRTEGRILSHLETRTHPTTTGILFPLVAWLGRPARKYYYITYTSGLGRPWAIRGIILLRPKLRAQWTEGRILLYLEIRTHLTRNVISFALVALAQLHVLICLLSQFIGYASVGSNIPLAGP
jgi:hypothetical protein